MFNTGKVEALALISVVEESWLLLMMADIRIKLPLVSTFFVFS
jgi:hypothetical protein